MSRTADVVPVLAEENHTFLEPLVRTKKVIVCCGAGGVGKTTTAAAIGVASAVLGRRVLVLTIDPARRLAEAMGLDGTRRSAVPVAIERARLDALGIPPTGELSVWMLAPEVVFEAMVRRLTEDPARVEAIFQNRLYQHLTSVIAGMQEYTAAEALHELVSEGRYDLVVLDTPPSRNALAFLEAPKKLSMFLDERVLAVFLPKKSALVRAASDIVEKVFDRAFGRGFYDDVSAFLGAFSGMFGGLRAHADAVRTLLVSQDAAFVLVTSPEPAALAEASYFQGKIRALGLPFAGYVLNRSWAYTRGFVGPERIAHDEPLDDEARAAFDKLGKLAEIERQRAERDRGLVARLRMQSESGAAIATPYLGGAVDDLEGLATLARNLMQLDAS